MRHTPFHRLIAAQSVIALSSPFSVPAPGLGCLFPSFSSYLTLLHVRHGKGHQNAKPVDDPEAVTYQLKCLIH